MLIVITIMMILIAAAATGFRPANDARRIREAARILNVALSAARSRAMETGQPCGVEMFRIAALPCSDTVSTVHVPPCFGGTLATSVANVTMTGNTGTLTFFGNAADAMSQTTPDTSLPPRTIWFGDRIQFNCQGPYYTFQWGANFNDWGFLQAGTSEVAITLDPSHLSQGQLAPDKLVGVPYRVFRSPFSGADASPVRLPASTVVDFLWSGFGTTTFFEFRGEVPKNVDRTTITFAPDGSVLSVFSGYNSPPDPTQPIYLLVGKRERIVTDPDKLPPFDPANPPNWYDTTNLWVVINPQTGLITTSEVAAQDPPTNTDWKTGVIKSRQHASELQSMGGK